MEVTLAHCFVFGPQDDGDHVRRISQGSAHWSVLISDRCIWGQRDWYPRILDVVRADHGFDALVPLTNDPAPDAMSAGPSHDDYLAHRKASKRIDAQPKISDVTGHPLGNYVWIVRTPSVAELMKNGFDGIHSVVGSLGLKVGLIESLYVVHA